MKPGFTLTVYPGGPIGKNTLHKGKLVVTRVQDLISECRITETREGTTIVGGDAIANIGLGKTRARKFVVEGDFDLRGTGKPSPAGTESRARPAMRPFQNSYLMAMSLQATAS